MSIKYGFFNSIGGDRRYNADDIGKYLMGIISSGVYADKSTSLQVLATDGMNVEVQPGRAMLHYHYMENDSPLTFTLDKGGTQDRVDAIVARLDLSNRLCEIAVKKGTEAAKPAAPTMVRTDTMKEYMLARVYITKLTSSITQSNITDTRADNTVCGWVTGVINQVDTSTLFVQWQAAYEKAYAELGDYTEAQKAAWENFLESLDDDILPVPTANDVGKVIKVNNTYDGYILGDAQMEIPITSAVPTDSDIWIDPNDNPDEDKRPPLYAKACGSSASLSLEALTMTKLQLDTWRVRSDTAFTFSNGGIKMPRAGTVLVSAAVYHTGPTIGAAFHYIGTYIQLNGHEIAGTMNSTDADSTVCISAFLVDVAEGDILTLHARDAQGGACIPSDTHSDTGNTNTGTALNVVYL